MAEGGKKGEGPLEIMRPKLLNNTVKDPITNGSILQVFDFARMRINQFNVMDMLNKQQPYNTPKTLPNVDGFFMNFNYNDHEKFIAAPEEGRFLIHKYGDTINIIVPFIPKLDFDLEGLDRVLVYQSSLAIDHEKKLMATTTLSLGQIDFFDLEGNYLRSTVFEENLDLQEKMSSHPVNPKKFIVELEADNNFIYALNYNNYFLDSFKNENLQPMEFLVFDWEGRLKKKYRTSKQRNISSFALDKIHNRIYVFSKDEEFYNIIAYNLE